MLSVEVPVADATQHKKLHVVLFLTCRRASGTSVQSHNNSTMCFLGLEIQKVHVWVNS